MPQGARSSAEQYQRFKADDSGIYDELFNLLFGYLVFKYKEHLDPQDYEDIAQETLIDALDTVHQVKTPDAFIGWLKKIAMNKASGVWKTRSNPNRHEIRQIEELREKENRIDQIIEDVSLNQKMKALTSNEAEAFQLTKMDGWTYKEAAELTGRTKESIAQAVSGACKRLRQTSGDNC